MTSIMLYYGNIILEVTIPALQEFTAYRRRKTVITQHKKRNTNIRVRRRVTLVSQAKRQRHIKESRVGGCQGAS